MRSRRKPRTEPATTCSTCTTNGASSSPSSTPSAITSRRPTSNSQTRVVGLHRGLSRVSDTSENLNPGAADSGGDRRRHLEAGSRAVHGRDLMLDARESLDVAGVEVGISTSPSGGDGAIDPCDYRPASGPRPRAVAWSRLVMISAWSARLASATNSS